MLAFTTVEPHGMFDEAGEQLVPRRSPKMLNAEGKFVCVYLHGDIQGQAGFDIPRMVDGELLVADGEHECLVELPDSKTPCLLVLWRAGNTGDKPPRENWRGLIVSKDDADSLKYARRCAADKVPCL